MSTARSVARNTIWLSLAQGIRIVLGFVLILYIANAYGLVWQGKFSILLAFLNIFLVLASFGLPRLIIRAVARDFDEGNRYFWTGLLAQGVTTVGIMLAMVLVVGLMPYPADTKEMLWMATAALPFFTLYSVAGALLRAHERMQYLVYAEVLSSIAQLVVAYFLLAAGIGVIALAAIRVSGIALAGLMVLFSTWRLGYIGRPIWEPRFSGRLLRESLDFFGMAGFDALLQRLDIIVLSVIAGEAATGIYDAAFQLIKVMMTLVLSFVEAIYPALSRLFALDRFRFALATGKSLQYGLILLLPVAVGTTLVAPDVIAFLYRRPGYAPAADVLAVLGWGLIAYFVQMLLVRVLMAGNRERAAFRVTAVMVLVGIGVLALFTYRGGAVGTAWGLTVVYLIGAVLAWLASRDFQIGFAISCLTRPTLAAVLMGVGIYLMPSLPWWAAIAVGAGGYFALAWGLRVFDEGDVQILRSLVRR